MTLSARQGGKGTSSGEQITLHHPLSLSLTFIYLSFILTLSLPHLISLTLYSLNFSLLFHPIPLKLYLLSPSSFLSHPHTPSFTLSYHLLSSHLFISTCLSLYLSHHNRTLYHSHFISLIPFLIISPLFAHPPLSLSLSSYLFHSIPLISFIVSLSFYLYVPMSLFLPLSLQRHISLIFVIIYHPLSLSFYLFLPSSLFIHSLTFILSLSPYFSHPPPSLSYSHPLSPHSLSHPISYTLSHFSSALVPHTLSSSSYSLAKRLSFMCLAIICLCVASFNSFWFAFTYSFHSL
ncbi:unnamed protein product [Acanthosepion pharaonis]|uniref:Uncharacterized protein n=1 Tax=Acanthosepion pharaonis TaxID=158019 RepID=A0A812B8F6_ACAPH|nr:unnamed protein product [Sepia pharaonis]